MNKVILVGNLTAEPQGRDVGEVRTCRFTVAVQRRFTAQGKDPQADFISVSCWRVLAENCEKYLKKGSKVGVVGQIQTRNYDDKDGKKVYVTEVVADEVEFLSPKGQYSDNDNYQPQQSRQKAELSGLQPMEEDQLPF